MKLIIKIGLTTLAVVAIASILKGISVADYTVALLVAIVLGLLNNILRPILILLTIPVTILITIPATIPLSIRRAIQIGTLLKLWTMFLVPLPSTPIG